MKNNATLIIEEDKIELPLSEYKAALKASALIEAVAILKRGDVEDLDSYDRKRGIDAIIAVFDKVTAPVVTIDCPFSAECAGAPEDKAEETKEDTDE